MKQFYHIHTLTAICFFDFRANKKIPCPKTSRGNFCFISVQNTFRLFACLFDSNSTSNSHTNHGVVTCTDKSHHFYVSGN